MGPTPAASSAPAAATPAKPVVKESRAQGQGRRQAAAAESGPCQTRRHFGRSAIVFRSEVRASRCSRPRRPRCRSKGGGLTISSVARVRAATGADRIGPADRLYQGRVRTLLTRSDNRRFFRERSEELAGNRQRSITSKRKLRTLSRRNAIQRDSVGHQSMESRASASYSHGIGSLSDTIDPVRRC